MASRLRPIPGAPALLDRSTLRPTVVIADLHLGLGATAAHPLGPPGADVETIARELLELAGRAGARGVRIVGDVKHPITGAPRPLGRILFDFFAELLRHRLRVEIIVGNHDGGLVRHLPREVRVYPAGGLARNTVGYFHGHRWPSDDVLACPRWVTGHLHPGYRFAPTAEHPDGKRPVWVRAKFARRPPARSVRGAPRPQVRELIVMPPFHPLSGLEALNRERPARGRSFLYRRFLGWGDARAYLLDGTDLGPLPRWPGAEAAVAATPRR